MSIKRNKYIKITVLMVILGWLTPTLASGKLDEVVSDFNELADEINESYEHYYVRLKSGSDEIREDLSSLKYCNKNKNFKQISSKNFASTISKPLMDGYSKLVDEGIMDTDDGYFSRMESVVNVSNKLSRLFNNKSITVCSEESVPAYSDGQTLTIIKVNNKVVLSLQVSFPD